MTPRFLSVLAIAATGAVAPLSALADCAEDCSNMCMSIDDPQQWDACIYPCLQSCLETEEWVPPVPEPEPVPEDSSQMMREKLLDLAALPECVDEGYACILGGTPCCGTNTCKGKFPNTTCQP